MEASVSTDVNQQALRENVRGAKGWLKFLGIMSIVAGAMYALTLVGIVVAWMPIWLGVLMVKAGSKAQAYADRGDPADLTRYTGALKTMFTIMGIVMIISMALGIISAIIGVAVGVFSGGGFLQQMMQDYGYGG
jgi:preprotein translocase subunit SecG